MKISIHSEIGQLEKVIVHTPGHEVENMSPIQAERSLYSDILNLSVAAKEYTEFKSILDKYTKTLEVKTLLADILQKDNVKHQLVNKVCFQAGLPGLIETLVEVEPSKLTSMLIEGVLLKKDTLTGFLSKDRYALKPLHNFFFTRDASISCFDKVIIGKMANPVREREAMIMEAIFTFHPELKTQRINPYEYGDYRGITIEGGDVIVAREDVVLVGTGARTTTEGVDFLLNHFRQESGIKHIIVQELPDSPESFIHLDMVFTFLDTHTCMVFEPLILKPNTLRTVHITTDNGKVTIQSAENIPSVLKKLGFDLKLLPCGGKDIVSQEREQWHSGANFVALGPGQIIGYSRNVHTMEELNDNGFEIIKASDILKNKVNTDSYSKFVIAIEGSEISRGGGGARCMTMPLSRKPVDWQG